MATTLYAKDDVHILDNLKGAAILSMLLFHLGCPEQFMLQPFMMPMFAFASGFAFKNGDLWTYAKRTFSIYLLGKAVYLPLLIFKYSFYPNTIFLGGLGGAMWYMGALVIWAACSKSLMRFKYSWVIAFVLIVFVYQAISALPDIPDTSESVVLRHLKFTTRFFLFYLVGVILPWAQIVRCRRSRWKWVWFILAIPYVFIGKSIPYMPIGPLPIWQTPLFLLVSVIYVTLAIAWSPGRKLSYLTEIGKASLNIYMFHSVLVEAYFLIWTHFFGTNSMHHLQFVFGALLCIPYVYLIARREAVIWTANVTARVERAIFGPFGNREAGSGNSGVANNF